MTIPAALGLLGVVSLVGVLSHTTWRLSVVNRQQNQLYENFLRLHKECRLAQREFDRDFLQIQGETQREFIRAVCRQLQGIEGVLVQIDNRTETVTDWARWWAAALEQATRR